jgi:hypothetical protein
MGYDPVFLNPRGRKQAQRSNALTDPCESLARGTYLLVRGPEQTGINKRRPNAEPRSVPEW